MTYHFPEKILGSRISLTYKRFMKILWRTQEKSYENLTKFWKSGPSYTTVHTKLQLLISGVKHLSTLLYSCLIRPCYAASYPNCWHVDFAGADNSPFDTGWPCISGGCSKSLEFAALSCQGHAFLACLPPWTQDCTV